MLRGSKLFAGVVAAGFSALMIVPANAVEVQFSTSGDRDTFALSGVPGAIVADPKSETVNLTVGVPLLVSLNTLSLEDVSPLTEATATGTLLQTLTVPLATGGPQNLSQGYVVHTSSQSTFEPSRVDATVAPAASPLIFDLGSTGVLTVTPAGGSLFPTIDSSITFFNFAELVLAAPIPEPASGLLVLGGVGLLMTRRQRRA